MGKINPDLQKERDTATFDKEEMTVIIYDGKDNIDKKRRMGNCFSYYKNLVTVWKNIN